MYSNIENVNILTSVLNRHGVRRVVVCPGSRNAPIVHNLNKMEGVTCYPVTDERSAGFVALGLAMGNPSPCPDPVAVCVTSGSALVNLYPAVVEAYYQKLPVIFISADRPEAWIGQQDGQTLPQANVFGAMVNKSVNLPIIPSYIEHDEDERLKDEQTKRLHDEQAWYCERQVHEAIIDCVHRKIGPVHINIQIAEPLYQFTQSKLPKTHWVDYVKTNLFGGGFHYGDLLDFLEAKKPMIVVGQDYPKTSLDGIKNIGSWAVTLIEPTALGTASKDPATRGFSSDLLESSFEEVLAQLEKAKKQASRLKKTKSLASDCRAKIEASDCWAKIETSDCREKNEASDCRAKIEVPEFRGKIASYDVEDFLPDFILYVGGNLVSKRLKQFLRWAARSKEEGGAGAKVWRASKDGDYVDTFMRIDRIFQCDPDLLAEAMTDFDQIHKEEVDAYKERWYWALRAAKRHAYDYEPPFSSMATVKYFQQEFLANSVQGDTSECRLVYGNSMAIRLACIYARQYVHCNRGVNGIEGSLSTAAGLSIFLSEQHHPDARKQQKVFCVLGDLSFFYDQNALWNQNLNGSLRIIVLNNGGGAIFGKFEGLKKSEAREQLVMAEHRTSAYHICEAQNVDYRNADDMVTMREGIDWLIHTESARPMLLEVFTDIDVDNQTIEEYYSAKNNSTLNITAKK